jgi:hypothetical protein
MSRFEKIDKRTLTVVRECLVGAVSKHSDQWVEWGIIEFEFAQEATDEFHRVIDLRRGHSAQVVRNQIVKHGHMASWYLANQVLTRQPQVKCHMGRCSGAWDIWDPQGEISYWAVADANPNWNDRLDWATYCANERTGLPPGLTPIDYMSYVPVPPPPY